LAVLSSTFIITETEQHCNGVLRTSTGCDGPLFSLTMYDGRLKATEIAIKINRTVVRQFLHAVKMLLSCMNCIVKILNKITMTCAIA